MRHQTFVFTVLTVVLLHMFLYLNTNAANSVDRTAYADITEQAMLSSGT